jgi:hypothetical protein
MSGEPLLDFLRKQPLSHPLELPDTESFLERGTLSHSPFLRARAPRFRSKLPHQLAVKLVEEAFTPLYWRMRRNHKLATRIRCRALSWLGREDCRDAARYLVHNGRHREEVQAGLLYLLFLGEPQDLEAARVLARNEAFTQNAVGIVARFSPDRDAELRELLRHLRDQAKESVTGLLLRNPTSQNLEAALDHGFPELNYPIWYWRWRDVDLLEEAWLWRSTARLWLNEPMLREALLSRPQLAARVAYIGNDAGFTKRALEGPRLLDHFFLDRSLESDWSAYILQALDSEEEFSRRQAWFAAQHLSWNLDDLLEARSPVAEDYVAWEQCVPYLKRPGLLEQFRCAGLDTGPAFELGLCPNRWASARSLEAVLRGISAFPGLRPDLVEYGLQHRVISVRLSALGAAAVWPDDTFLDCVRCLGESDPVAAVRERAAMVANRRPLDPERSTVLQQAFQEMRCIPKDLISHFLGAPTLAQYELESEALTYVEFADHLNQLPGFTFDQSTSQGHWAVCMDLYCQHVLWAEKA